MAGSATRRVRVVVPLHSAEHRDQYDHWLSTQSELGRRLAVLAQVC